MKNGKYIAGLIFVSVIWGATFPLVKESLNYISPFGFIALRFILGSAFLMIFYFRRVRNNMRALRPALVLSIFLFMGYAFQTVGLKYTTSSNAGFITGLYVVFTPVASYFIVKERITRRIIGALGMSLAGLYLLSGVSGFNYGDILEFLCAIAYAVHVALIGKFSREYDAATLTILQLFFVFFYSTLFWGSEGFSITLSPLMVFGVIFTGIFATAIGILVQVHGQKHISPSRAAIIFTTEPVFAGIFSYIFLGETFGVLGAVGAAMILIAMLLAATEKNAPGLD